MRSGEAAVPAVKAVAAPRVPEASVREAPPIRVPEPVSPVWIGAAALLTVAGLLGSAAFFMREQAAVHLAPVVPLYHLLVDGPQAQAQLRGAAAERAVLEGKPSLLLKAELFVSEPAPLPVLRVTLLDAAGKTLVERDYSDYLPAAPTPGVPQVFRVTWTEPPADVRDVRVSLVPLAVPMPMPTPPVPEAPALPPSNAPAPLNPVTPPT